MPLPSIAVNVPSDYAASSHHCRLLKRVRTAGEHYRGKDPVSEREAKECDPIISISKNLPIGADSGKDGIWFAGVIDRCELSVAQQEAVEELTVAICAHDITPGIDPVHIR